MSGLPGCPRRRRIIAEGPRGIAACRGRTRDTASDQSVAANATAISGAPGASQDSHSRSDPRGPQRRSHKAGRPTCDGSTRSRHSTET